MYTMRVLLVLNHSVGCLKILCNTEQRRHSSFNNSISYVIEIFTVVSSIYEMGMQSLPKTLPKEKRDVKQVCALCTPASVVYP